MTLTHDDLAKLLEFYFNDEMYCSKVCLVTKSEKLSMREVDLAVRERLANLYSKYPDQDSWVKGILVRILAE